MGDAHVGGEGVERLVEVVHLHEDAHNDDDPEHVCARVRELVVARERELDGDAEALDRHHAHAADEAADRDVYERVRAPVLGRDGVDHHEREHEHGEAEQQEACGMRSRVDGRRRGGWGRTGLDGVVQDLVDGLHVFVGGRV